jgi:hypothetical protein
MKENDPIIKDDGGDMTADLLNSIVHRWQMSNLFLTKYLRRSMDTVKSYRYGRLPIPQKIADKMRRLHVFLATE